MNEDDYKRASSGDKNLTNADLRGVNLRSADLRGANLTNADLKYAYVNDNTKLEDTDLKYAKLEDGGFDWYRVRRKRFGKKV